MTTQSGAGRPGRLWRAAASLALAGAMVSSVTGCVEPLAPGEFGSFRYVEDFRGAPPALALLPPISDRDGNAYVLWNGFEDFGTVKLHVGHAGGGWTGSCELAPSGIVTGEARGIHGFVGRGQGRAWFWVGERLVGAAGRTGGCVSVLETDPSSGADLGFLAVVPWIRETPSTTTTIGWIISATDAVPYQVVVDLNTRKYTTLEKFKPGGATDIAVLGVGANLDEEEGVVLVRYTDGGSVYTQARFMDRDGVTTDRVGIGGFETLPAYGMVGHLQASDAGLYAGLDEEGQLVVFDHSGGARMGVGGMTPVGVHRWEGELYVVGEASGRPKIAHIDDDGDLGKVRTWDASEEAADALKDRIEVIDDRSLPSTLTSWKSSRTAIGAHPFVHGKSLDHYADGTTTWLIAGPGYSTAGSDVTAVAYAPVGIVYE